MIEAREQAAVCIQIHLIPFPFISSHLNLPPQPIQSRKSNPPKSALELPTLTDCYIPISYQHHSSPMNAPRKPLFRNRPQTSEPNNAPHHHSLRRGTSAVPPFPHVRHLALQNRKSWIGREGGTLPWAFSCASAWSSVVGWGDKSPCDCVQDTLRSLA